MTSGVELAGRTVDCVVDEGATVLVELVGVLERALITRTMPVSVAFSNAVVSMRVVSCECSIVGCALAQPGVSYVKDLRSAKMEGAALL